MSNIIYRPVLQLNAAYEPMTTCSVKRAMKMIIKGVAKTEETIPVKLYTSKMWDEVTGEFITVDFYCPSVIRLLDYRHIPAKLQHINRKNIYSRDDYTCMYCGKKLPYRLLSFDHVIPKSAGGKNTWENLVTCCLPCNHKKDDRLLSEIPSMKLIRTPKAMTCHTRKHILRNQGAEDPLWRKYLFFSHDTPENRQFS